MSGQKGYIYAELNVHDPELFNTEYAPRVQPVLEKYRARFLVAGGAPTVREGERDVQRIVFLEFDSPALAKQFYDSPEYQDVIAYRFKSATTHLYILEGAKHNDPTIRP